MRAVHHDNLKVLRRLLLEEGGINIDDAHPNTEAGGTSNTGGTAFHSACEWNHPYCVEALVRAGCDVGIKDNNGYTGRQIAEELGSTAVLEWLRVLVEEQLRAAPTATEGASPESLANGGGGGGGGSDGMPTTRKKRAKKKKKKQPNAS